MAKKKRVIIMGAAGRDFHNYNVYYRDNPRYEVVAFTAIQIPNIAGRRYPKELAGKLYPKGIPIFKEAELRTLIKKHGIDEVVFSYSDVSHEYVMHRASMVIAAGADFRMLGAERTMLKSKKPVIAVCAVRTGCGKSQTTRRVAELLRRRGKSIVVVRHPMPYGNLSKQRCQRFGALEDLDRHKCTIEEREEYESHIQHGNTVYAGVDYEQILRAAEKEADVVLWDGGNNDLPFFRPDLHIVVADPHRAGHEVAYHPGEANLRMAQLVILNKVGTAGRAAIEEVRRNVKAVNPRADVIEADSEVFVRNGDSLRGKRVLVVEDGPTLTHGDMAYGAGHVAARRMGAKEIVDPRPHAVGTIKDTFAKFPHIKEILPAMGYGDVQMGELQRTINKVPCDLVLVGTPFDLGRLLKVKRPLLRVTYELDEAGTEGLSTALDRLLS